MPRLIPADDEDERPSSSTTLFGPQKAMHELLGGGKVADVLLWRDYRLSAGMLFAFTVIWFLFEVVEYSFITLLCHMSITAMLLIFIWTNAAALLDINPPKIGKVDLSKQAREAAMTFNEKLGRFMWELYDIARGKDLKLFLLAIASLWIVSVIGSYCSSLNLSYFVIFSIFTMPALYERYQREVNHLATEGSRDLKKLYRKFDKKVLNKIPRGPVKEKKLK